MYICPNCGKENLDTAKFCIGCGKKTEQPVKETPNVTAAAPIAETAHAVEPAPVAQTPAYKQPLVQPMQPAPVYEQTLEQSVFTPSEKNNEFFSQSAENFTYTKAANAQPVYEQPKNSQPRYVQPQYTQPQYTQPHYVQPQYAQPLHRQPTPSKSGGRVAQGLSLSGFLIAMIGVIATVAFLILALTDKVEWGKWGMIAGLAFAVISFVPSLVGLILACNEKSRGVKGVAVKNGKVVGILGIIASCVLLGIAIGNMFIYESGFDKPNSNHNNFNYNDYLNDFNSDDYLNDFDSDDFNDFFNQAEDYLNDFDSGDYTNNFYY